MSGQATPLSAFGTALAVRLHRSREDVEALRPWWQANQTHPNSDLDNYLMVCALAPNAITPAVISVWRGGECLTAIVGRLENTRLQGRFGYWDLPGLSARVLTVVHQGVIGEMSPGVATAVVAEFNRLLTGEEVDLVRFSFFPEGSPIWSALGKYPHRVLGLKHPGWSLHWERTIEDEIGFILKNMRAKHRGWIRGKQRASEETYAGRLTWRWFAAIEDVAPLCEAMEKVACNTYQRGLNAGFRDDVHHRQRLALFARQGALRVMLLQLDEKPVGFWMGLVYKNVFHSSATGYVPELRDYEIGTQMFIRVVDELVAEKVHRFDFGLGDAHYKQRFGDRSWRELRVQFFAPTVKGLALRYYLAAAGGLNRAARQTAQCLGSIDRIKQRWRRALAPKRATLSSVSPP